MLVCKSAPVYSWRRRSGRSCICDTSSERLANATMSCLIKAVKCLKKGIGWQRREARTRVLTMWNKKQRSRQKTRKNRGKDRKCLQTPTKENTGVCRKEIKNRSKRRETNENKEMWGGLGKVMRDYAFWQSHGRRRAFQMNLSKLRHFRGTYTVSVCVSLDGWLTATLIFQA